MNDRSATPSRPYAGDVGPQESWDALAKDKDAQLVDVRTEAEWAYVGLPDLSPLGRQALLCEWQSFPSMAVNQNFAAQVAQLLERAGHRKGAAVYFLCRSGARSRSAAVALTSAGYGPCFNIADGFEGALDGQRHRGHAGGWKALGLPWIQS
jgi:rhodanese-related sulfurtransferase